MISINKQKCLSVPKILSYFSFKWSEVTQSCLTLCNSMDCSPPGSSIHGILLDKSTGVGFLSRDSSQLRDQTRVSHIVGRHFTIWATGEVLVGSLLYPPLVRNTWETSLLGPRKEKLLKGETCQSSICCGSSKFQVDSSQEPQRPRPDFWSLSRPSALPCFSSSRKKPPIGP